MIPGAPCIVRWVDIDALDSAYEFLLKGFECQQIVAKDEPVIE